MKHTFINFYREVQPGDGSGGLGPSLNDILSGNQEGLEPDGVTLKAGYMRNAISGVVSKDPNYKDPNPGMKPAPGFDAQGGLLPGFKLAADGKTAVKDDGAGGQTRPEGVNEDGTLMAGYKKEGDKVVKDPDYISKDDATNADGTLKEGFKQLEDGSFVKDPNYKAPGTGDEGDEGDEGDFIAAVENITGVKYTIEYPENIDPVSPEGIAFRENHIREQSAMAFEQYLAQNDPRSYAYMLHRQAGGTDETFFGDNKGFQLPTKEAMQASADSRAAVYKQELMALNNLDATTAQVLVDAAVKDNSLTTKSDGAWDKLEKAQKDQLKSLQDANDAATKKFENELKELNTTLTTAIKSGIGFVVPEAEQAGFQKFVIDNLRYDNGKFFVVQNLDQKDLKTMLEALYFQHKKGDLTKIVNKQAQTQAAQKLRLKLKNEKATPGAGAGGGNLDKTNLPLHQILPSQGQ